MKKMLRSAAALTLAGCMMSANVLAATTFSDVPGHWGASYINRAVEKGLVSGMGDGTYGVDKTLSAAQFTTMVCNLFYKDAVASEAAKYTGPDWWYPYMTVAYAKGLLTNTVVGNYRKEYVQWERSLVEGDVSRYDMAQMLINVVDAQKWQAASAWDVLSAQNSIKDWSTIPQQYQSAVANAYARGFLSGMGDGSFSGASAMTRAQGAVVLCKLLDAQTKEKENTYTNTTNLVNGKAPTKSNVKSAVAALRSSYPKNMVWNGTNTYTSGVLGAAYGCDAYSYTISDKVFGNLKVSKVTDHEDMKPGDLLYLNSLKCHVVITNVDGDDFDYTYCTSNGAISWSGYGDIDDLTTKDILYTRYTDNTVSNKEKVLSNGKKATESNVEDLIEEFLDDEYDVGDEWDKISYTSDVFGKGTYEEGFAYYLSDYIFGDDDELDYEELDDLDDLRVGDVIYSDALEYGEYGVVTKISGSTITYLGVDDDDEIYQTTIKLSNLDEVYTRYPSDDDDDDDNDNNDGLLSNGKSVTTSNVKALIEEFLDDEYEVGDEWDKTSYTSDVFGKGTDEEGFAYYLSDYIFDDDDDLDYDEVDDFTDLRPGDVIYSDELYAGWYGVVTRISSSTITYLGVDDDDEIYQTTISLSKLDKAYTRYPVEKSDNDGTLSNGKSVTTSNVKALIEEFLEDEYDEDDEWDKTSYTSNVFGKGLGEAGFAYYLSDYIFGDDDDLDYDEVEDFTDLRPGDIIRSASLKYGDYGVVTTISSTNITYLGVDDDDEIYKTTIKISKLSTADDKAYTRYPAEDSETLSNGKSVTTTNVKALLKAFLSDKDEYDTGDEWDKTSYTSNVFGKGLGEAGFAYYLSDYVFGDDDDLDYKKVTDVDDLRVGDVIRCESLKDGYYAVIYEIDDDEITYLGVDDSDEIYKDILDADDWDEDEDVGYTRYPS